MRAHACTYTTKNKTWAKKSLKTYVSIQLGDIECMIPQLFFHTLDVLFGSLGRLLDQLLLVLGNFPLKLGKLQVEAVQLGLEGNRNQFLGLGVSVSLQFWYTRTANEVHIDAIARDFRAFRAPNLERRALGHGVVVRWGNAKIHTHERNTHKHINARKPKRIIYFAHRQTMRTCALR